MAGLANHDLKKFEELASMINRLEAQIQGLPLLRSFSAHDALVAAFVFYGFQLRSLVSQLHNVFGGMALFQYLTWLYVDALRVLGNWLHPALGPAPSIFDQTLLKRIRMVLEVATGERSWKPTTEADKYVYELTIAAGQAFYFAVDYQSFLKAKEDLEMGWCSLRTRTRKKRRQFDFTYKESPQQSATQWDHKLATESLSNVMALLKADLLLARPIRDFRFGGYAVGDAARTIQLILEMCRASIPHGFLVVLRTEFCQKIAAYLGKSRETAEAIVGDLTFGTSNRTQDLQLQPLLPLSTEYIGFLPSFVFSLNPSRNLRELWAALYPLEYQVFNSKQIYGDTFEARIQEIFKNVPDWETESGKHFKPPSPVDKKEFEFDIAVWENSSVCDVRRISSRS